MTDILKELEKPGRDPRPAFKTATFADGVETLADLQPGMVLEGVVTNVAAFGAFVDIGVHQDGLVHVSALSHTFVKDPRDVVKPGDVVRVKVLERRHPAQAHLADAAARRRGHRRPRTRPRAGQLTGRFLAPEPRAVVLQGTPTTDAGASQVSAAEAVRPRDRRTPPSPMHSAAPASLDAAGWA